jgi:4-hydroxy-2-oxoheptanedioate aldolase
MTKESPAFALAHRLRGGAVARVAWCLLPSPPLAETIAHESVEAVLIDMQHGTWDTAAAVTAISAITCAGGTPVVRIPVGDFAMASRALDFGAIGIVAPMIETAEHARAFVAATKYPPLGGRSWGPFHAMGLAGVDDARAYLATANDVTIAMAMIETHTALENVEAIAATPGIDALFIGPFDLSIALSKGADIDSHSPLVAKASERVLAAAKKAGKFAGIYCASIADARAAIAQGFRWVTVGLDVEFLHEGVAGRIAAFEAN